MRLVFVSILLLVNSLVFSQNRYGTASWELILSSAQVRYNDEILPVNPRFTAFVNLSHYLHQDISKHFGVYSGISIRNIGFITNQENYKSKRRTYTAGLPLALKAGNMREGKYLFAGAEYAFAFHYKHKIFTEGKKIKYSEWLSDRTNPFLPSVFAGFHFKSGHAIKLAYYPQNMLNRDFSGQEGGIDIDFEGFSSTRMFYVSLELDLNDNINRANRKKDKEGTLAGLL